MTTEELLVIAAAAAAFVLINIVMWKFIAARSRKERQKNPVSRIIDSSVSSDADAVTAAKVKFIITENIVMLHTDEKI